MIRTSRHFASRSDNTAKPGARNGAERPAPASRSTPPRCNYQSPAELFVRESSRLRYRSFDTAAEAVRYVNEEFSPARMHSCTLEVDEVRFVDRELAELYLAPEYPLVRSAAGEEERLRRLGTADGET